MTYHMWSRICAIFCPPKSSPRQHTLIYKNVLHHIPHRKQNLCHFLPAPFFCSAEYTDLQLYTIYHTIFEAEFVPFLDRPNLLLGSIRRFTTIYYITPHIWSRICAISCLSLSSHWQHTLIYNYILYHIQHLKQNLCHFLLSVIFSSAAYTD